LSWSRQKCWLKRPLPLASSNTKVSEPDKRSSHDSNEMEGAAGVADDDEAAG